MKSVAIYPYKEDPFIRCLRVQTWYRAVTHISRLTARELERLFGEDSGTKSKRSCIWNKYRRGEIVPRSGYRDDGQPNLVERVEERFAGTAKWLTLPLWRVADKAPMQISEIRRCYEELPKLMRQIFIHKNAHTSDVFWRRSVDCEDACDLLIKFGDLEGLTAVLILVKEAEITQDQWQHQYCLKRATEYISRLESKQRPGVSISGLTGYLTHTASSTKYFFEHEYD